MPRNLKTKVTSVCMTLMMMTSVIYPVFADYECEHCYSGETTATCRTAGYTTYTCTLCKDTYTEPAAPVDHEYTVWESCGEDSLMHRTICQHCGCTNGVPESCELVFLQFADTGMQFCVSCGQSTGEVLTSAKDIVCTVDGTEVSAAEAYILSLEEPFAESYGELTGYDDGYMTAERLLSVQAAEECGPVTVTSEYFAGNGQTELLVLQYAEDGTWTALEYTYDDGILSFTVEESCVLLLAHR